MNLHEREIQKLADVLEKSKISLVVRRVVLAGGGTGYMAFLYYDGTKYLAGENSLSDTPPGSLRRLLKEIAARGFSLRSNNFCSMNTGIENVRVRFPRFSSAKELIMKLELGGRITVEDFQTRLTWKILTETV